MQDLYTENYKTLKTSINGDILYLWFKGSKIKMSILTKLRYRFKAIPNKILEKNVRVEFIKLILKTVMKWTESRITKRTLKRRKMVEGQCHLISRHVKQQ